MGRGENAYKMRWADEGDALQRVVAYNRTPNGRLEWLRAEVVKPALRRTRDALWTNVVETVSTGGKLSEPDEVARTSRYVRR
jgi:hypothetical protein